MGAQNEVALWKERFRSPDNAPTATARDKKSGAVLVLANVLHGESDPEEIARLERRRQMHRDLNTGEREYLVCYAGDIPEYFRPEHLADDDVVRIWPDGEIEEQES